MATVQLMDLPNETLALICRNLCTHCQQNGAVPTWEAEGPYILQQAVQVSTLLNLCLTSRRLCGIAQPVLFHEFCHTYGRADRFIAFARVVALHRPDLGASVAKLIVYNLGLDVNTNRLSDEDVNLFRAAAVRYGLQDRLVDQPSGAIRVGGYESQMSWMLAVLAHLPNLVQVGMVVSYIGDSPGPYMGVIPDRTSLYQMATEATVLPSLLGSVRKLSLHHWDTEGGFRLDHMTLFLSIMPGLRRLDLSDCVDVGTLPPPALAAVTDLRVERGALTAASIENLLSACGPLVAFRYDAGGPMISQVRREPEFLPRHVAQALLTHGHGKTLRDLQVDLSYREWGDEQHGMDIVLGDIRGLKVLDRLRVSGKCMYGDFDEDDLWKNRQLLVGTLPRSLRRLAIFDTNRHLFESLMALAAAAKTTFPRLKFADIHANWSISHSVLSEEQIDTLLDTFNEGGVAFTNRHWRVVPEQYMR